MALPPAQRRPAAGGSAADAQPAYTASAPTAEAAMSGSGSGSFSHVPWKSPGLGSELQPPGRDSVTDIFVLIGRLRRGEIHAEELASMVPTEDMPTVLRAAACLGQYGAPRRRRLSDPGPPAAPSRKWVWHLAAVSQGAGQSTELPGLAFLLTAAPPRPTAIGVPAAASRGRRRRSSWYESSGMPEGMRQQMRRSARIAALTGRHLRQRALSRSSDSWVGERRGSAPRGGEGSSTSQARPRPGGAAAAALAKAAHIDPEEAEGSPISASVLAKRRLRREALMATAAARWKARVQASRPAEQAAPVAAPPA
eukprot:TRINITY_DN23661_c0_g3_i1.p2 TRINITY_DN23661_c0_g3~~TRINITY_DN23661_c0_g3_i1.p2  ORF type:complete len:310 (+),score=71.89 TRINITY_DN23661_c0_g3_i1:79-1008(+)